VLRGLIVKVLLARKFLPLYGVLVALALAFMSPVPSLAGSHGIFNAPSVESRQSGAGANSVNGAVGGYGNDCGIRGDGTHDHGKACPNRPFPG
jgi:hypothetical protein